MLFTRAVLAAPFRSSMAGVAASAEVNTPVWPAQALLGAKRAEVLQCAAIMLRLHAAAFNQEDTEHPVCAIKDKYKGDTWHAVALQAPLGSCQPA